MVGLTLSHLVCEFSSTHSGTATSYDQSKPQTVYVLLSLLASISSFMVLLFDPTHYEFILSECSYIIFLRLFSDQVAYNLSSLADHLCVKTVYPLPLMIHVNIQVYSVICSCVP